MRAVDDLVNEVRDAASREHLQEAVRAYSAGALRSAIISTWIAVALDLTSKIRELADLGEAEAQAYVSTLDAAIDAGNIPALTKLERELLAVCRDRFTLINAREHDELERLVADRHVCAHPAFVAAEVVFKPTSELCRVHLATAVDAVLRHPPTPGRKAIERFIVEVKDAAWPATVDTLGAHLRAQYLDRGKPALRRGLAELVVKCCLEPPPDISTARMAQAAHALDAVAPALLEQALADVVRKREETSGLTNEHLLRLTSAMSDLDVMWRALPATSRPRVVAALEAIGPADLLRLQVASRRPMDHEAAGALDGALDRLSPDELSALVAATPGAALVPAALRRLGEAPGWRTAEKILSQAVVPLAAWFTAADVVALGEVLRTNSQVRQASGVPPQVTGLFGETADLPGAFAVWEDLSGWLSTQGRDNDPTDWYAYPALARLVEARRESG
jgi:hypothetical protein